jgi:two-component system, NarL family, nitrate/nitrite response regulator NarL
MRVLVVAAIRLYRDGVADALRALPDVEYATTAANGAAAVAAARRVDCNVVLLDMEIESSTQTAAALITARPDIRVVALGVQEDGPDVVACAEAGVSGYVSRDASFDDLAAALRSAVRGEAPCSGKIAAGLIRHIALHARSQRNASGADMLTRREREVLRLLETDMSNKEIARALDLQLSTVKNHVHNVLTKLGASGRRDISGVLVRLSEDPGLEPVSN